MGKDDWVKQIERSGRFSPAEVRQIQRRFAEMLPGEIELVLMTLRDDPDAIRAWLVQAGHIADIGGDMFRIRSDFHDW